MLPRKTVSFPSFRSPLNSRQRNEPQLDRTEQPCRPQSEKSEDKRAKSRRKKANPSALKVKLAKVSPNSPAIPKTSRRRLTLEPTTPKTNINQGKSKQINKNSALIIYKSVIILTFFFTQAKLTTC